MIYRWIQKLRLKARYEEESRSARLQMETQAQQHIASRIRALEISIKNEGRIK